MGKKIDLVGKRFNRLFVIVCYIGREYLSAHWICLCDCGEYVIVSGKNLKSQGIKSCGCLKRELLARRNFIKTIEKDENKKTICTKCGKEKLVNSQCKPCKKIYDKLYHEANYPKNKDRRKLQRKAYYKSNKIKINTQREVYNKANKTKVELRDKNRHANYFSINKEKVYAYRKLKRKTDPKFRLKCNMSNAINSSLKHGKDGSSWLKLVDYTLNDLKKHLEKQFTEGMTWDNYGEDGWEVDHIIPVSVFNFTKPEHEDFKKCWWLKNLQPLLASENRSKSNKIIKHFQPSLPI